MIIKFLKTHFFVLLLAFVVGAIYAGPDIYHAFTPGYQGILMTGASDATFYLTDINKSYAAHGLLGDPYLYEYQDARNPFQYFFIDFALGKVGAALHVPIDKLTIAMEFIFPAFLTLLLYAFVLELSGSRLTALVASAAMLLGNELVHPDGLTNAIQTFALHGRYSEFLNYSRPVNPQVSSFFFFGMLWGLWSLWRNPRSSGAVIICGIGFGFMVYIYIYFWAFTFALFGVMFLYGLVARNWPLVIAIGMAGVIGVLCMVPFLVANVPIILHGGGSDLTQAILTHHIVVEKLILFPLFLYACMCAWARWSIGRGSIGEWASHFSKKYIFVFLLLITGVVVSNQQVFTGRMIFVQHFHFFTNIPVFLLSMSLVGMEVAMLLSRTWRTTVAITVVIVVAWYATGVQLASYKAHQAESLRYQQLAPVFSYLRGKIPAQAVVLENQNLSSTLTIYTQDFSYNSSYDATYQVPQDRVVHDYLVLLGLRSVTAGEVRSYVYQSNNRVEIGYTLFVGTYWRDKCGSGGCFPDSVLENLIVQYKNFLAQPLVQNIHAHKIDYVLWDKTADPEWKIAEIVKGAPLVTSGDFALYAVR